MRNLILLLSIAFFISCSSVPKKYLTDDDICHYNDPFFKITEEEIAFNNKKYDSILSIKGAIYIEDENHLIEIQKDLIGKTDKETKLTKWIYYYSKGNIKSVSFSMRNSSSSYIGKETYYDQQGNITKVIDYEKGYKICWAEAIEIVKQIAKKDIKKYNITGFNLSHTNLNEYPKEKPVWAISLDGKEEYEIKDTKVYWIDGVTGKYVKTTKIITEHE